LEFAKGATVAQSACLGGQRIESNIVGACWFANLACSDERLEEVRLSFGHQYAEHGAPRVPQQNDFVFP
jgi:hypothetical protein